MTRSILGTPAVAAIAARLMQNAMPLARGMLDRRNRRVFPELPGVTSDIVIPTSIAPAPAMVYRSPGHDRRPAVHVNFHGGGYVMPGAHLDDPLCRYLAAEAGVVVVNVEYAVAPRHRGTAAPRHRFPAPPHQAFEVVQWVAEHGEEHGWDGSRLTIGGQSAGGGLAAAVARLAWERGGPAIALQVLHYPPLDLATRAADKPSTTAKPMLRPWMGEVFDNAYAPDPTTRTDRLLSPANPADTADLTGIAPALVITPEHDRLHGEGLRYAERLRKAGALVGHVDVPGVDHAYDMADRDQAREYYALIARHIRQAT